MSMIFPSHTADITTANSPTVLVQDGVLDAVSDGVPDAVSDGVPDAVSEGLLDEMLDGKTPCDFSL
jgi:hypothetical protein